MVITAYCKQNKNDLKSKKKAKGKNKMENNCKLEEIANGGKKTKERNINKIDSKEEKNKNKTLDGRRRRTLCSITSEAK